MKKDKKVCSECQKLIRQLEALHGKLAIERDRRMKAEEKINRLSKALADILPWSDGDNE